MKFTINKFLILLIIIVSFYVIFSNLTESKTQESRIAKKVEAMLSGPNVEYDATRIIVKYKDGSTSQKALKVKNKNNFLKQSSSESIELYFQQLDQKKNVKRKKAETAAEKDKIKDKLIEYLGLPDVEYAQPNYIYHSSVWTVDATTAKPGDYNNANHWYYSLAKLPELWQDQGCGAGPDCGGSNTVTVAVIDSGLAYEAYDDSGVYSYYDDWGHVNNGKNFTGVSSDHTGGSFYLHTNPGETPADGMDNDCNGIVDDYNGVDMYAFYDIDYFIYPSSTCPGGTPTAYNAPEDLFYRKPGHPTDTFAHGTFVTGLIAGVVDNELSATGTVSPAFNVKIMPIAANIPFLNSFYTYDIVNAIDYAVFYGADVINLSLGSSSPDFYMEQAINTAYNNGVTVVAASGNNGSGTLDYPARYDKVVSVGAINSDNSKTGYSQYGNGLDLVAYVGQGSGAGTATFQKTWSCFGGCTSGSTFDTIQNKYGVGTSFATPQVSAAAALALSVDPTLTPLEIYNLLTGRRAVINGSPFHPNTGFGAVNFQAIYNYLINTVTSTSNPNSNPSTNGDNLSDITAFNNTSLAADVTPSTGSNFGGGYGGYQLWNSYTYYNPANWTMLKPADVDGDGTLDLIAFNKNNLKIAVTLSYGNSFGKGAGNFQIWNSYSFYNPSIWQLLNPADVNGDGKADIIAFNKNTTAVYVTLSNGLSFF